MIYRRQRLLTQAAALHAAAAMKFQEVIDMAAMYSGSPAGEAMVRALAEKSRFEKERSTCLAMVDLALAARPLHWWQKLWDLLRDWWYPPDEEMLSRCPHGVDWDECPDCRH